MTSSRARKVGLVVYVAALSLASESVLAQASTIVDLRRIGHIAPQGRVQDREYNSDPVVDAVIAEWPSAIDFLASQLEDETKIEHHVFDYWPEVRVGDVAFVILCDLFLSSDSTATVPGFTWDEILERGDSNEPAYELFQNFLSTYGRRGLRKKVATLLEPYAGRLTWDEQERCFRISTAKPPNNRLQRTIGASAFRDAPIAVEPECSTHLGAR